MKHLYESILDDIDDALVKGDDDVMRQHILDQLHDKKLYSYFSMAKDSDAFIIKKKGNKWIVDVKVHLTCYGTKEGYVTDGTFSFGVCGQNFIIMSDYNTKCGVKSLKYGPTLVNGTYCIMDCPKLKNLRYCPQKVMGDSTISYSGITTLKYFPEYIKFVELIGLDKLKTFDICPTTLKEGIRIQRNGFESDADTVFKSKVRFLNNPSTCIILDKPINNFDYETIMGKHT